MSNSIISAGRAACLWEWAHLTAACAAAEAVSLCRWIWTGVSKRWSHSIPNCEICISLGLQNVPPGKIFLKGCPSFRNCQINLVTNDFLLGGRGGPGQIPSESFERLHLNLRLTTLTRMITTTTRITMKLMTPGDGGKNCLLLIQQHSRPWLLG